MGAIFIPHQPPPSARAVALSQILAEDITEFRRSHSDISSYEIQQAVQLALMKSVHGVGRGARILALTAVAAVAVAGLVGYTQEHPQGQFNLALFLVPIVAVALIVIFMIRIRRG